MIAAAETEHDPVDMWQALVDEMRALNAGLDECDLQEPPPVEDESIHDTRESLH